MPGKRTVSPAELDALAEAWVRSVDPDPDPELWPRPDEGRLRGEVLSAEVAILVALAGPGDRYKPGDVTAADPAPDAAACWHCGLAAIKVRAARIAGTSLVNLCGRCYEHARRHAGRLPSARLNHLHRRRLGRLDEIRAAA